MPKFFHRSLVITLVAVALLSGLFLFLFQGTLIPSYAAGAVESAASLPSLSALQQDTPAGHPASDLACRTCHADTDAVIQFPDGSELPVQVDIGEVAQSAHGTQAADPLSCTSCHAPAEYQFPHPPVEAESLREYALQRSQTCERCHVQPHITSHPDLESEEPVVCTDCHGSHDVLTVEQLQEGAGTEACVNCHVERDVEPADAAALTQLIQAGLFAYDQPTNGYCLSCHGQEDFTLTFPNGDVLSLTVSEEALHDSVHGIDNEWRALDCVDCHEGYRFPHEPVEADSRRIYELQKVEICAACHEQYYEQNLDSVHAEALREGNLEAAVCTDCHGAHDTPVPNEPRARISHTCEQCHSTIFNEYAESVHGEALLMESNEDVPTCIECHGVHNIADPTTTSFRVRSPELCAECHADEELMAQYGISTDVFSTYVADFHGTTVTLFNPEHPDAAVNEAVCYDCHGVHNIKSPDDPEAGIKANLLETCQKCHPDATANFPDAWTSHFEPSLQNNTLVFLVDLFYAIVIPVTVGFFVFLVATDIYRRVRQRVRPSGGVE